MAALKENSKTVFNYVKAHDGEDFTAKDIAEATGLNVRQVNGIVTSAFQKKELMYREEAEIQVEDGSHAKVKCIRLTDAGRAFDPEAPVETAE